MYYPKLIGPRLYLSPINSGDAKLYTRWLNDQAITLGLGNNHTVYSLEREQEALEQMVRDNAAVHLAIVLQENDELIGNCSLMDINHIHGRATLGIFIGDQARHNQGLGTEAMALLLDFGFRVLNLHNINLKYFSFNQPGQAAYRKLGFQEVGRRREAFRYNGCYYDEVEMDILEDDFREGPFHDIARHDFRGYQF